MVKICCFKDWFVCDGALVEFQFANATNDLGCGRLGGALKGKSSLRSRRTSYELSATVGLLLAVEYGPLFTVIVYTSMYRKYFFVHVTTGILYH